MTSTTRPPARRTRARTVRRVVRHAVRHLAAGVLALGTVVVPAGAHAAPALPTGALPAAADDEVTWSVQPSSPGGPDGRTRLDYAVEPGTTVSDWVAVSNFSDRDATFRVYAADATTDYDTGAFTLVGADVPSTDLGSWVSVDSAPSRCPEASTGEVDAACVAELGVEVKLGPGESANLPFTITVPHDAAPGDHAAGIVASFVSQTTGEDGAAVRREDRVGTRAHLRVDGALNAAVGVSGVTSGYTGTAFGTGTATVAFDVTNTGNVLLDAAPEVRLAGPFGIEVGAVDLAPLENLVPGGTAHVEAVLTDVPPLALLFSDIVVVPTGVDGEQPQPTRASSTAWALPWAVVIVLVLLVAGVVVAVVARRRSRERLAAELAEYTERVRAEARALARAEAPVENDAVR
jgi:hypothetical protein